MKIIGAGFGLTGTMSLKTALEKLGFDPCYHMEIIFLKNHIPRWLEVIDKNGEVDWAKLMADYPAGVDHPVCDYYPQLLEAFPDG